MKQKNRTHLLENENAFEVLSRSQKLEEEGKKIINLGIGQPDFSPPSHVIEAGIKALKDNPHGYSNARGILELREAISYADKLSINNQTDFFDEFLVKKKVTKFASIGDGDKYCNFFVNLKNLQK